jgi:hypothetical protein
MPPGDYVASPKLQNESIVRRQISRYSGKVLGLQVNDANGPTDPDTMNLQIFFNNNPGQNLGQGDLILSADYPGDPDIVRESEGIYTCSIDATLTSVTGTLEADWTYTVDGQEYKYVDYFQIVDPMPMYESLTDGQKFCIEQVTWTMGDLFDSTTGGPHLVEEFQTHFNYERLAQLMSIALSRINMMWTPITNFSLGAGANGAPSFPDNYNNVLMLATYVETIRHLIRSYVEQPQITGGVSVAYTDRRDYMQRWQQVLQSEGEDLKSAVRLFKRKQMNLGQGSFIVAGGIFGSNRTFKSGGYAASTRGARFMPVTFVFRTH